MVDARKERIDEERAWELLRGASKITIAKGKKVLSFDGGDLPKEEILKGAMGPSGNLRAPTYRTGDRFVIGFNDELYRQWVSEGD